jgi:hypothetical protein
MVLDFSRHCTEPANLGASCRDDLLKWVDPVIIDHAKQTGRNSVSF